jgi:hypothetical protein
VGEMRCFLAAAVGEVCLHLLFGVFVARDGGYGGGVDHFFHLATPEAA